MNLASTIYIYGGGPGSGCNPQAGECGRKSSGDAIYHGTAVDAAQKILKEGIKRSGPLQQPIPVVYATKDKRVALSFAYAAGVGLNRPIDKDSNFRDDKEVALIVLKPEVTDLPHIEDQLYAFPKGVKEIDFAKDIPPKYIDRVEIYSVDGLKKDIENVKPIQVLHAGKSQAGETYLVVLADGHESI